MMTDKETIIQDLKVLGEDIYAAFNGKPAKIPAIKPFGAILDNKYKHR